VNRIGLELDKKPPMRDLARARNLKAFVQTALRLIVFVATFAATPADAVRPGDGFTITTDHIYGHKAGMALTLDVVRPEKDPNGIGLLYMVSRGWVSNYFDLERAMATSKQRNGRFYSLIDRGYTLFIVRHGSAPHFKVPDAVSDVRRALRYVGFHANQFKVDPNRLGVFGNSAGGHLALMLGTTPDKGKSDSKDPIERVAAHAAAVVAYYPPTDLRQSSLKDKSFLKPKSGPLSFDVSLQQLVSPIVHVTSGDAPTLLIHGDQDTLVPLTNSKNIHDAFLKVDVDTRLVVMEGAGHAFPGEYGSRAATALANWFDHHLRDRASDL